MNTAKVFLNGRSQAVRLPREFQFSTDEVYVNRVGGVVMLFARDKGWDILAASLDHFSEDFISAREQGRNSQERPAL